eukprot:7381865-Prymnesium_polylepis.1
MIRGTVRGARGPPRATLERARPGAGRPRSHPTSNMPNKKRVCTSRVAQNHGTRTPMKCRCHRVPCSDIP